MIGRRGGHVTLKELEELERKEASRAADREKMTQRMSQKGLAEQAREKALERMHRKGLTPGGMSKGGRLLSPTLSAMNDDGAEYWCFMMKLNCVDVCRHKVQSLG